MVIRYFPKFFSTLPRGYDVYILSAVRTPIGSINGLFEGLTASQLSAVVLKEALERAKVPTEELKEIFISNTTGDEDIIEKLPTLAGLKKPAININDSSGLCNFVKAVNSLLKNDKEIIGAVGVEFMSSQNTTVLMQNEILNSKRYSKENMIEYNMQSYKKLLSAYQSAIFKDEIVNVKFRKKGKIETIDVDEILNFIRDTGMDEFPINSIANPGDGAAGFILANEEYIKRNNLKPLAKIISFATEESKNIHESQKIAIKRSLEKENIPLEYISQWEINDYNSSLGLNFMKDFNINPSCLNKNGSTICLKNPISMSGARVLCHLTHSLPEGKLGCAVSTHINNKASSVIIQKQGGYVLEKPQLTLYTKHPCPLCNELKEQLKPFYERFDLEEVDIEAEENRRIKKLYRYEIPVLFLDSFFLCKNKLDLEYFVQRLEKAEKLRKKN